MNNIGTTLTELEKVERWIDQKRIEIATLNASYNLKQRRKDLVDKIALSRQVALAEKWLADQRALNQPMI